jgi:hypothetical protein
MWLRVLITGGDALSRSPSPGTPFQLANNYGPTENTVVSTWSEPANDGMPFPDIGGPVDGTTAYVLDPWMRPVPPGHWGQLYVGGRNVARGYHANPRLTADRFLPDPFGGLPGDRIYATGDTVCWQAHGALKFAGRMDDQVKIRGFRIELGDVRAALLSAPGVQDAACLAVTLPDQPEKQLVAVVAAQDTSCIDMIRAHTATQLPRWMMPAHLVRVDVLPLNASGKLDRAALQTLAGAAASGNNRPLALRPLAGSLQAGLVEVIGEAIGRSQLDPEQNFFEAGGHSLSLASAHVKVQTLIGREFPMVAMFEHPTVAKLAQFLQAPAEQDARNIPDGRDRAARQRAALRRTQHRGAPGDQL